MKLFAKVAAAAVLAAGALAITATSASAAIVCNREGYCWHVKHPYKYRSDFGLVIHEDAWHAGPHDKIVWREHHGRGYWKNGIWIRF